MAFFVWTIFGFWTTLVKPHWPTKKHQCCLVLGQSVALRESSGLLLSFDPEIMQNNSNFCYIIMKLRFWIHYRLF